MEENKIDPASAVFLADYRTRILEHHLDVFGHMNNATYLQLFEEARWEFITAHGYGLAEIVRLRQGPTILEIRLQFKKELRNREAILIRTWNTGQVRKIGHMRQIIYNGSNEECCIGDFTIALFDLDARKIIAPTAAWAKAVGLTLGTEGTK